MGCKPYYSGNRLNMDCLSCGLGLGTNACIASHLKTISLLQKPWKTMRYEEFNKIDIDEENSTIFLEFVGFVKQLEKLLLEQKIYGHQLDDFYQQRKQILKEFYQTLFQNPALAIKLLEDYSEPVQTKSSFLESQEEFIAWKDGIVEAFKKTKIYQLSKKEPDLRKLFLSILNLKSTPFSESILRSIPKNARLLQDSTYTLDYGIEVSIYYLEGQDVYLYTQKNEIVENLPDHLVEILKEAIELEIKKLKEAIDYKSYYDEKLHQFRQYFLDKCSLEGYEIDNKTALAMAREAANWAAGLGSPIENLALDSKNITDIYVDSQNSAIYIEHQKYGLCHTLWQYDKEILERVFLNILSSLEGRKRFDEQNPVIDIMLTRLSMRCHLQRPPATFGDYQAAFRIMKQEPFTYPEYLKYKSITPFFAGYDDLMVNLGFSEAVLGLKGVGKTAFTAAKIAAIGPKKRILPIEDIEEIPVNAYRKHGFHIGAIRVAASDRDDVISSSNELDLVSMTNAALRMGDACVIINEIRSRTAIQGVINMLNTQPGIFLLYNLHAQSIKDIQDRLELVFGIPASAMFSTDRYSFLKKVYFEGRQVYRLLGYQYESDLEKREFVPVFNFLRGKNIDNSTLECLFCQNQEASSRSLYQAKLDEIASNLKLKFIPPALNRKFHETSIDINTYLMYAFFKGKLYDLIYNSYLTYKKDFLLSLDFVLKCNEFANHLIWPLIQREENIDWAKVDEELLKNFSNILKNELEMWEEEELKTSEKRERKKKS
ncbi:MAG: Flp pilus assembly complex ATPase component TadA [Candidatus Omnitrophica bacterium]|nr:Flp pilus assembly complex ATPase component TadA [Candidatus Omnitrophota bacterium]